MRTNIYYLFLALMALLLMSCGETPQTEKDSVIEYDVIEIGSCEYIIVQSRTYYGYITTSIYANSTKRNLSNSQERAYM